ncbi:MAG TPA: DUF47 family protein [Calditrichaeota bacterium]|nr:DUF47 family protein [Calditrichota bacterium]
MAILFKSTRELEARIDEYLDAVSQGVLVFKEGVKNYIKKEHESFQDRIKRIDDLEAKADNLRRNVENRLYQHSLIPEHRGDVLGLLENMDDVIDTAKETMNQFDVEKPYIPEEFENHYIELSEMAVDAADAIVLASRAFFKDIKAVKDHLHKVYFYEKEADRLSDRIKRKVFASDDLELCQKFHLRYFALHIDTLADKAESVADRLSIYTIKRTI